MHTFNSVWQSAQPHFSKRTRMRPLGSWRIEGDARKWSFSSMCCTKVRAASVLLGSLNDLDALPSTYISLGCPSCAPAHRGCSCPSD